MIKVIKQELPFEVGDIIFFDWYDENGGQDNISDHVGIVTRLDITNNLNSLFKILYKQLFTNTK